MNQIFQGFCINRFSLGPLHYISSCSDIGFESAKIFVFEKQLPISVSRGVDKIAYRIIFKPLNNSILIVKYPGKFLAKLILKRHALTV